MLNVKHPKDIETYLYRFLSVEIWQMRSIDWNFCTNVYRKEILCWIDSKDNRYHLDGNWNCASQPTYSCALECSQFIIHYIFFPCFVMWPQAILPFDLQTHSNNSTYAHIERVITSLCVRFSMNERQKLVIIFIHSDVWIFFQIRVHWGFETLSFAFQRGQLKQCQTLWKSNEYCVYTF